MLPDVDVTITEYLDTPINRPRAVGTLVTVPFAGLLDHLLSRVTDHRTKGAAGYWVAAPVPGPRSNAVAQPTRVVAIDYDDAPDGPDWAALGAYQYCAHTTDRHTDAAQRWRVWVLLDREYTTEELTRASCPWSGAHLRAISQPAFVPTMGDDTQYAEAYGGDPLRLSDWYHPAYETATPPVRPIVAEATARVFDTHGELLSRLTDGPRRDPSPTARNALVCRWLSNPDGTNRLAGALGATLAEWGWADADIAQWMQAWLSADTKLAKHTDDALRAAAKRRAGDRIVGFPVMDAELGPGVWAPERPAHEDVSAIIAAAQAEAGPTAQPAALVARLGSADPPFHWVTAGEMLDYDLPDVQWLVEALSFAPGAPGLCTGYSGTGKTTTLQDLALSVATPGRRFLNHFPVRHGSVAHIDLEQGTQQTLRTYRSLGLERSADLVCSVLPSWRLTDRESVEALARAAVGRSLVIIDSFRVACLGVDENSSDFAEPLGVLGQISEATGCAFMLNHHSGKNNENRMKSARGTSAITAACSVHWSFEREDLNPETRPCLQLVKSRNHQTEAMVWETYVEKLPGGTPGSFELHARAQPAAEPEDIELKAAIVDSVTSDSIRNIADLAKLLGRRKQDVVVSARQLGVVIQNGILVIP